MMELIISVLIPLFAGGLSGFLTRQSAQVYAGLTLPPGAPPAWVFPVVWTILYFLMGISAYWIYRSDSPDKKRALVLYAVQLIVNLVWPLLFFGLQNYWLAFVWLVLLWILVFMMIQVFARIDPSAAWLQLPYLIWLTFAGYLNLFIALRGAS